MLKPGDRIGDWVVDSALGEGGMGAVYRAHNALVPDIVAAVKVLKPHALEDARERFFREVQAVHRLHHPNIVRVTGFGEDPARGLLWMAMDLVTGGELSDRIQRGPTAAAEALHIFDGLVDALAHAHGLGVFHRDLKPGNVLIDHEGRAKLVDFGIAVQQGQERLTGTGLVVGTPAYLPPEVFDADAVDPGRADVYAIGQMLHEVLLGEAAFPADPTLSEGQRMGRLLAAKIKTESLDPGEAFSPQVRALVREATDPDPANRVPTAAALRERIRRLGPETQWVRIDAIPDVAAPTYEPDDRPIVASPTVDGGFDPSTQGVAAPTLAIDRDEPEPEPEPARRRGGVMRFVLVALILLVLGGTALVVVGAAGAGAWYYLGDGDVGSIDGLTGLVGDPDVVGVYPSDHTDAVVDDSDTDADPDDSDTDDSDTDEVDTDEVDTDEAPPILTPTPTPTPNTTRTDITNTAAFKTGWKRSAAMMQKCAKVHELSGERDIAFDLAVVVRNGQVLAVNPGTNTLSRDVAACVERAGTGGDYPSDLTGTGIAKVRWKGAIIHEGPVDPLPPPPPTGALDAATVSRLVEGNGVVRRCLSVLRKELSPPPEQVAMAVQVGPDGTAKTVTVGTTAVTGTRSEKCLIASTQRIVFPASAEGGVFDVVLTP